jgi:hypothetical protein
LCLTWFVLSLGLLVPVAGLLFLSAALGSFLVPALALIAGLAFCARGVWFAVVVRVVVRVMVVLLLVIHLLRGLGIVARLLIRSSVAAGDSHRSPLLYFALQILFHALARDILEIDAGANQPPEQLDLPPP